LLFQAAACDESAPHVILSRVAAELGVTPRVRVVRFHRRVDPAAVLRQIGA
jgi:hypothetical protein